MKVFELLPRFIFQIVHCLHIHPPLLCLDEANVNEHQLLFHPIESGIRSIITENLLVLLFTSLYRWLWLHAFFSSADYDIQDLYRQSQPPFVIQRQSPSVGSASFKMISIRWLSIFSTFGERLTSLWLLGCKHTRFRFATGDDDVNNKSVSAIGLMLLASLWFGLQAWISQAGIRASSALAFNTERYLIAALAMGVICLVTHTKFTKKRCSGVLPLVAYAFTIGLESQALAHGAAGRVTFMGSLFVAITPFLGHFFGARRSCIKRQLSGVLLC